MNNVVVINVRIFIFIIFLFIYFFYNNLGCNFMERKKGYFVNLRGGFVF